MAGFIARDFARALRRKDELDEQERQKRRQTVADQFAQLQIDDARRRAGWAVEDRPAQIRRRDIELGAAEQDATFRKNQQQRTTDVLNPREDTVYETTRVTNRAAVSSNAISEAERDWRNVEQVITRNDAIAARHGDPFSEEEKAAIRSAAQRARNTAFERDTALLDKGAAALWSNFRTPEAVEREADRLANLYAKTYPEANRDEIALRIKTIAAEYNPTRVAEQQQMLAAATDMAQQKRAQQQMQELEAQYNDPGLTDTQRQWIEYRIRQLGGRLQQEQIPVARQSGEMIGPLRSGAPIMGEPRFAAVPDVSPFRAVTGGFEVTMPDGTRRLIRGTGANQVMVDEAGNVTPVDDGITAGGAGTRNQVMLDGVPHLVTGTGDNLRLINTQTGAVVTPGNAARQGRTSGRGGSSRTITPQPGALTDLEEELRARQSVAERIKSDIESIPADDLAQRSDRRRLQTELNRAEAAIRAQQRTVNEYRRKNNIAPPSGPRANIQNMGRFGLSYGRF